MYTFGFSQFFKNIPKPFLMYTAGVACICLVSITDYSCITCIRVHVIVLYNNVLDKKGLGFLRETCENSGLNWGLLRSVYMYISLVSSHSFSLPPSLSQPDNSTAQYVLRMMIGQHKFYRSELEGTPGISWMKDG